MKSETDQKRERQGGQQETNRGLRNDMLSANDTNIMTSYEPIDPEGTQNKRYGPSCTNMNGMNPTRNLEICRTCNSKGRFGKTDYIGKGKQ